MIRGLLTDEEWSFFEPFVVSASPLGGRPARDHRRVLDAGMLCPGRPDLNGYVTYLLP